jgi:hypothetical protein
MFLKKAVEKIKTHILCSINFFFYNRALYEIIVEKYCRAEQATDGNIALTQDPKWTGYILILL